jgi:hypothetical protein
VDDRIGRTRDVGAFIPCEVEVSRQGVEDLAAVGQIGLECEDACTRVGEVDPIEIEDLVAARE